MKGYTYSSTVYYQLLIDPFFYNSIVGGGQFELSTFLLETPGGASRVTLKGYTHSSAAYYQLIIDLFLFWIIQ